MGRWSPTVIEEAPRRQGNPLADALRFGVEQRRRRQQEEEDRRRWEAQEQRARESEARMGWYQQQTVEHNLATEARLRDAEERMEGRAYNQEQQGLRTTGHRPEFEPTEPPLAERAGGTTPPGPGAPKAPAVDKRAEALARRFKEADELIARMWPGASGVSVATDSRGQRWVKNLAEDERKRLYREAVQAQNAQEQAEASAAAAMSRLIKANELRDDDKPLDLGGGPALGPAALNADINRARVARDATESRRIELENIIKGSATVAAKRAARAELAKLDVGVAAGQQQAVVDLANSDPTNYLSKSEQEYLRSLVEREDDPPELPSTVRQGAMEITTAGKLPAGWTTPETRARQYRDAYTSYIKRFKRRPTTLGELISASGQRPAPAAR